MFLFFYKCIFNTKGLELTIVLFSFSIEIIIFLIFILTGIVTDFLLLIKDFLQHFLLLWLFHINLSLSLRLKKKWTLCQKVYETQLLLSSVRSRPAFTLGPMALSVPARTMLRFHPRTNMDLDTKLNRLAMANCVWTEHNNVVSVWSKGCRNVFQLFIR